MRRLLDVKRIAISRTSGLNRQRRNRRSSTRLLKPLTPTVPKQASDPHRHTMMHEVGTTSPWMLDGLRQNSNEPAWEQFVQLYRPWLETKLRSFRLRAVDVDDLIQEVLIVVLKEVRNFQHNQRRGAFRAWLRNILVNRAKELRRKHKRARPIGGSDFDRLLEQFEDDSSQASRAWDREHDQFVIGNLLRMIADDFEQTTWDAFRAVVIDGRKAADVAKELGMSQGAVWIAKSRVLQRLREVAKERPGLDLDLLP
ncbi:unnamed protein product [uncultured bacterium]|nr:unnamed protein product [uncultured bacterium]